MRSSVKQFVVAALAGVAALALNSAARAQVMPPAAVNNPLFRVNLAQQAQQQAALGLGALGNPYAATLTSSSVGSGYGGSGSGGYPGYYNPYYSNFDPFGGYFRGVGDLVGSYGKYAIDRNQARLLNQAVEQEKIKTRRMLFDEWRYYRNSLPTVEDLRKRDRELALTRARSEPPLTDVLSATSLNTLLDQLKDAHAKGQRGPRMELEEDYLKKINVASGHGGNIGLFKNGGKLGWPLSLRGEAFDKLRRSFEENIDLAVGRARDNGQVDAPLMKELLADARAMHDTLEKSVDELSSAQYIEAKRYLNLVDDGLKALQDPNVANYFNRKYEARGKLVSDLVDYMKDKGLTFAPATPGEEAAYRALQTQLAAYDEAASRVATTKDNKDK